MKLLFAADMYPTSTNMDFFLNGNVNHLFGDELLTELFSADFRCINVESPVQNKQTPVNLVGPLHCAPLEFVNTILNLKTDLVVCGNNHIYDQGSSGLESTLSTYEKNNISYVGAGRTKETAAKPYILEKDGLKIGIYSCCEYESSSSFFTEKNEGANVFDPFYTFDEVRELKKECDGVIVLFHGGREHYRYPTPDLQKTCRKFVEVGADFVICQHSHCIGCQEVYNGATIVYGQGNFIFDRNINEYRKDGLLVSLDFDALTKKGVVSYIPFVRKNETIRKADESESKVIIDDFIKRSEDILAPEFIKSEYLKLAYSVYPKYVKKLIGNKFFHKVLIKLTNGKYLKKYYKSNDILELYNILTVNQHKEILHEVLVNEIYKLNK